MILLEFKMNSPEQVSCKFQQLPEREEAGRGKVRPFIPSLLLRPAQGSDTGRDGALEKEGYGESLHRFQPASE